MQVSSMQGNLHELLLEVWGHTSSLQARTIVFFFVSHQQMIACALVLKLLLLKAKTMCFLKILLPNAHAQQALHVVFFAILPTYALQDNYYNESTFMLCSKQ